MTFWSVVAVNALVACFAGGTGYWLGRWRRAEAAIAPTTLAATAAPAGFRRLVGRYAIWQDGTVVWQSDPSSPALEAVRAKQAWERARGNVTFYDNGIRRDSK